MKPENISSADRAVSPDAKAVLEGLAEPAAIVSGDCRILCGNRALHRLLGSEPAGRKLASFHVGDKAALDRYLRRCLGSGSPLVAALHLGELQNPLRYRLHGSRIVLSQVSAVLLRITRVDEERFGELNRRVSDLKRQISERLHAEALLRETVHERELLFRELQHRVKNNMHMLSGLLQGAEREARGAEAKAALRDVFSRVSAVGAVQQLLYSSEGLDTIESSALVDAVVEGALAFAQGDVSSEIECDSVGLHMRAAISIALIINELATNAVKYGRPAHGRQQVAVRMRSSGDELRLEVLDNGPGYELQDYSKRASGIGLVRGLLRQLGGAFDVQNSDGARCVATLPLKAILAGTDQYDRLH